MCRAAGVCCDPCLSLCAKRGSGRSICLIGRNSRLRGLGAVCWHPLWLLPALRHVVAVIVDVLAIPGRCPLHQCRHSYASGAAAAPQNVKGERVQVVESNGRVMVRRCCRVVVACGRRVGACVQAPQSCPRALRSSRAGVCAVTTTPCRSGGHAVFRNRQRHSANPATTALLRVAVRVVHRILDAHHPAHHLPVVDS